MTVVVPKGPFALANQNQYFGSWPQLTPQSIVMAFPVEGWATSAAVVVSQGEEPGIAFEVHGANDDQQMATMQAVAALSLDVDAVSWPAVGERDQTIGVLQTKYGFVRPTLFHSPYEAAAHFIIGHRISMKQGQSIRQRMAEVFGDVIEINGRAFHAFPRPARLLDILDFPGLSSTKIERLHGIADAARSGLLTRENLNRLSIEEARQQLLSLDGIGPFFASGILNRGVGVVDDITDDELTRHAVKTAYHLSAQPSFSDVQQIASKWAPFRMWAEVLLHIWLRREVGLPKRERHN